MKDLKWWQWLLIFFTICIILSTIVYIVEIKNKTEIEEEKLDNDLLDVYY